jgi:selenocysteine-specific elongation factor
MPRRAEEMLAELLEQKRALAAAPGLYVHAETAAAASERVLAAVAAFHRQSPESPGMPREQLRQALPREKAILDGLVAALLREGRLVDRSGRLASAEHRPVFRDEDQHQMEAVEDLVRQAGFQPPGIDQLVAATGTSRAAVERVLRILREHGRLVEVAAELVFHVEAVARGREILEAHFRKQSRLESVEFKYLLDTTRKFALPLLDYFDRVGVTTRVGNTRYLKSHLPPPAARPAPKR